MVGRIGDLEGELRGLPLEGQRGIDDGAAGIDPHQRPGESARLQTGEQDGRLHLVERRLGLGDSCRPRRRRRRARPSPTTSSVSASARSKQRLTSAPCATSADCSSGDGDPRSSPAAPPRLGRAPATTRRWPAPLPTLHAKRARIKPPLPRPAAAARARSSRRSPGWRSPA